MAGGFEEALKRRLDAAVDAALAEERIVGMVVVVAREGAVVYRRAAGFADREAGQPVREDTPFRLASMTKPVVSAAALALVDRGLLKLDDPVTTWLPSFRPRLADGRAPTITVRQLLTHTSGLGYGLDAVGREAFLRLRVSGGLDQPGLSLEENLRRLQQVPLSFEPGTRWQYSLATDVLGAVVARAGGGTLGEVVQRWITGPLGIDLAFPSGDPRRVAMPYVDASPRPARMTEPQEVPFMQGALVFSPSRDFDGRSYPSGGASMVGTADAYVTFLEALRTGGGKILRPATAAAMTSNQIGSLEVEQEGGRWGFGYGFAVLKQAEGGGMPSGAGTVQWGGVYGNHFWVDPAASLTVVVLTNTALAGMAGPFPASIRHAVYEALQAAE
ncbi:serine hydrolase [Chondromyces crocatus]|uniref:Serine hydrolase n=1 Tax=Chondromyces crocatus TaxID=52 RepID=A0A0K1ESI7_CHOCO|nr:serine hydrolase [Chondromyces crocatus]